MKEEINKRRIIELLAGDLPGKSAQSRMGPKAGADFPMAENCREAAVLLLLYKDKDIIRIVFIKRNEYDGPHSGQISFPGGMKESFDDNFKITALRETEEEIGISRSHIEVLGKLSPFLIPVSNFCVHPFVAWMDSDPEFSPDKSEVDYLICPSLDHLRDPKNKKTGNFLRKGVKIKTPYIDVEGEMLWGATAMMLNEFMELIDY